MATSSPRSVVIRRVSTSRWVNVAVTVAVAGRPVSGSAEATRSPASTSSMGLAVPSAMSTRVPAGKHPNRETFVTDDSAPAPAPVKPPKTAPPPVAPRNPPTVCGPGPVR